jgi:hypothetical protein
MVNVTFAVPEELHQAMRKHTEVKWSEIARKAMWEHARKIELMEKLVVESKLTEKQAEEIGEKIKARLHKRHFG